MTGANACGERLDSAFFRSKELFAKCSKIGAKDLSVSSLNKKDNKNCNNSITSPLTI